MDLLSNIIIGTNELYVCKCLLDLDLTLMNIWRDNYYLESDYNSKTKLSIIFLFAYIGAQSDLTQVMTLKKKIWSSASELQWTVLKVNCENGQTVLRNSVCN